MHRGPIVTSVFTNGILDIVEGHRVGPEVLEDGAIPRHHFGLPCSFDNLNTPLFDQLVFHQLEDDIIYTYLLALIGRLFLSCASVLIHSILCRLSLVK